MRVVEPGHIYDLNQLDGEGKPLRLVFVNREKGTEHEGTQTQEVLRMLIDMLSTLIDRTNHCDACLRWIGNDRIIKAMSEAQRQMNLALLLHEERALERKMERRELDPATIPLGEDGHFALFECPLCEERVEGVHVINGVARHLMHKEENGIFSVESVMKEG